MIEVHADDINGDNFCYETSIKFAEEFGKNLLEKILVSEEFLVLEKRYKNPLENLKEIAAMLSFNDGKAFGHRLKQLKKYLGDLNLIEFRQYTLPKDLTEEFEELIPQWIKDIGPYHIVVQTSKNGDILPPHKGHQRQSSLFMLLQGNGEQTKWYRETGDFKIFDFFRTPDLNKIENIVTAELEPYKWTMFNHKAWHSVHKYSSAKIRINIGIDFDNVSAEELLKIIKEHE